MKALPEEWREDFLRALRDNSQAFFADVFWTDRPELSGFTPITAHYELTPEMNTAVLRGELLLNDFVLQTLAREVIGFIVNQIPRRESSPSSFLIIGKKGTLRRDQNISQGTIDDWTLRLTWRVVK